MARKKKPVDDTPICDPAYLRRINPIWMPGRVPKHFWEDRAHRRDYLLWLAHRLRFRTVADFYRLELTPACCRNRGHGVIEYWGDSALTAVQDCFPEFDWKPWLFPAVPKGFWELPVNRRSYFDWLGQELGFRRPQDWYRIGRKHLECRRGLGLLQRSSSLIDLMREYLPQLDWDRVDVHRPITVEDVLAWADSHHARHGTWPTCVSGEIPETGNNWTAIDTCLRLGHRGLPGGASVARVLERHRGVRVGRWPAHLSEEQVLAWADAHFAQRGTWPMAGSGAIPATRETWNAVDLALRKGSRGLRGGSSLAKFLARHRGVRNRSLLPPLSAKQILAWAAAYFASHGKWPNSKSGPIAGSQETWLAVALALRKGSRGLKGGSSLAKLLRARGLK